MHFSYSSSSIITLSALILCEGSICSSKERIEELICRFMAFTCYRRLHDHLIWSDQRWSITISHRGWGRKLEKSLHSLFQVLNSTINSTINFSDRGRNATFCCCCDLWSPLLPSWLVNLNKCKASDGGMRMQQLIGPCERRGGCWSQNHNNKTTTTTTMAIAEEEKEEESHSCRRCIFVFRSHRTWGGP